jgi:flagellar protein FlgJ
VLAAPEDDSAPGAEQQAFLDNIAPWAKEAAAKLGVTPELVQAHAALESGWGQRPLRNADGASSHNLFGIKAGPNWDGAVSDSATTEYVGGAAVKTSARFRAYPDGAAAFRDYAQMLLDNPRYKGALGAGNDAHTFAQGLAKGGYATDPAYAAKLARLAGKLQGISG